MYSELKPYHENLINHSIYSELDELHKLRVFMEHHVFAVWDFMSLLKGLQRRITSISVPWKPSEYSHRLVRLINEIVLGEESDVDENGRPTSHFALYLTAMKEVGADTSVIFAYLKTMDPELIPEAAKEFVLFNLDLAENSSTHELCAAFFFGREKLVPEMFKSIVSSLEHNPTLYPSLMYYLQRHISVDAEEHGPMAMDCLKELCDDDPTKINEAMTMGRRCLELRKQLWDKVHLELIKNESRARDNWSVQPNDLAAIYH